MADKFLFDMGAYTYSTSLKAIALMFEAAKTSLQMQREEIDQFKKEYETHLLTGGEAIGEWEDGNRLWEQNDLYRLEQLAIDDALIQLRNATTIIIYHLWEKNVPNPRNLRKRDHTALVKDANDVCVPLHTDIDALCFATNYLKHGSTIWLDRILSRWASKFGEAPKFDGERPAWAASLNLKDSHIQWFIEIAQASERPVRNL